MTVEVVSFGPDDLAPVLAALRPGTWVNLQPEVELDDDRTSSGFFGIFGGRGPAVPLCTWVPAERAAGIQHDAGPKLARRIDIPPGWRVTQDHPRRGLVVDVPEGVADAAVLQWLVATGEAICSVPRRGPWVAEVRG
jgi:hypothetical protein